MPARLAPSVLKLVREIARSKTKAHGSHGWDHVERVYRLCELLGRREGGDLEVLRLAALLHDVGRGKAGANHALESAREAQRILPRLGLEAGVTNRVIEAIRTHRFRGPRKPSTLEAQILSDADKLDAMGAIGVYRASAFGVETRRPLAQTLKHFHEKLLKLRHRMCTRTARRLAEKRHRFMLAFLKQVKRELELGS